MSKQQHAPGENRKDNFSVLERIRRRTGLLVGLVGLALVIFILESLLGSGASIFGNDQYTTLGTINGRKIDRNEFLNRLEQQMNNYRARNQGKEVDEQVRGQAIDNIFQQYVVDRVVVPEFEKAGIQVGDDELFENVVVHPAPSVIQNLTDPNTGKVNEQFARPDGSLDPAKWRQAVQSVTGESELAVKQMEDMVKNSLYFSKFRALLNRALYVTDAEAEREHNRQQTTASIKLVLKRYDEVSDSLVKVEESDLEKYYKEHSYEFRSSEDIRQIEYVTFNVMPSPEDLAAVEKDANRVAEEMKGKTQAEDSVIMSQENEGGAITMRNLNRKNMIIRDTGIYHAQPGTVFGPYNEGQFFKIYKLESVNQVADSARVRHILIGLNDQQTQQQKRSKEQAKKIADSLLVLLKEKKVSFDSLVKKVSDDPGSLKNGGDYGWFDENESFVEPFKNAGLRGVKGNISVVETQFGYHIIEVLDVSKTKHTSYQVAEVFKQIAPSDETNQKIFAEASRFAGENNTAEQFDRAVEKQNLVKRRADIREGEYRISGLDHVKDIAKWAFTAKKGEVAVFSIPEKHVVVKLSGVRTKGILPIDEVKPEVTQKVREQKKSVILLDEFQKAGDGSLEQIASKLNTQVVTQDNYVFQENHVNGLGNDVIAAGTIQGTAAGKMTKAVATHNGVFRAMVESVSPATPLSSLKDLKKEIVGNITSRSDYEMFTALREASDIEFHRSRID